MESMIQTPLSKIEASGAGTGGGSHGDGVVLDARHAHELAKWKAKQHEFYISVLQDALQLEDTRQQLLQKSTNKLEIQRLEKRFARERTAEKERILQLQQDHAILLQNKIRELYELQVSLAKAAVHPHGQLTGHNMKHTAKHKPKPVKTRATKYANGHSSSKEPQQQQQQHQSDHDVDESLISANDPIIVEHSRILASTLEEQATKNQEQMTLPAVATTKSDLKGVRPISSTSSSTCHASTGGTSSRLQAVTTQEVNFYKKMYAKSNAMGSSLPALPNLRTMTETALLERKRDLLKQLHGVLSIENQFLNQQAEVAAAHSPCSSMTSCEPVARNQTTTKNSRRANTR